MTKWLPSLKNMTGRDLRFLSIFLLATFAFVLFSIRLEIQSHQSRTVCRAVNATNASLLNLIESASALSPKDPPPGSTAREIAQFKEQQRLGGEFLTKTRITLTPKRCK